MRILRSRGLEYVTPAGARVLHDRGADELTDVQAVEPLKARSGFPLRVAVAQHSDTEIISVLDELPEEEVHQAAPSVAFEHARDDAVGHQHFGWEARSSPDEAHAVIMWPHVEHGVDPQNVLGTPARKVPTRTCAGHREKLPIDHLIDCILVAPAQTLQDILNENVMDQGLGHRNLQYSGLCFEAFFLLYFNYFVKSTYYQFQKKCAILGAL